MRLYVNGVGILGPGLNGWAASQTVLSGARRHVHAETLLSKLEWLPPAQRRRTSVTVKYAMTAGMDALAAVPLLPQNIPTVFAASGSDGELLHDLCVALAEPKPQVSPTRFHNSVHNAAAGYWSIATGARVASTSMCAYDWTFVAALLETAAQVLTEHDSALLIAYDVAYPPPLRAARAVSESFACALLLCRDAHASALCSIDVEFVTEPRTSSAMADISLEDLRRNNPAARALPLLAALARRVHAQLHFEYMDDAAVTVTVAPMHNGQQAHHRTTTS